MSSTINIRFRLLSCITFCLITMTYNSLSQTSGHTPLNQSFESSMWGNKISSYTIVQTLYVNASTGNDSNAGTDLKPYRTINKALSKRIPGTRIIIYPGTYREYLRFSSFTGTETQPLIMEAKETGTVVISGSDVWTGWTKQPDADVYARAWFKVNFPQDHSDNPPAVNPNDHSAIQPLGLRREMVFVDHNQFEQMGYKADLKAGSFWVDTNAHMVYLKMNPGEDPNTKLVEVPTRNTVLETWLYYEPGFASYFVLKGLIVEHAVINNELGGYHFLLKDCEFRNNGGGGLMVMGTDIMVKRCKITNNGGNGIGIGPLFDDNVEHEALFEQCTITGNKWRTGYYGQYWGDATSTFKILVYRNLVVRGCKVINNWAGGIWFDNRVNNALVEDCYIANNTTSVAQMYYEIGFGDFLFKNNTIANGGEAVSIGTAYYATLRGNILYNNIRSICSNWDPAYIRNDGGPYAADFKTVKPTFLNNIIVTKTSDQKIMDMPSWEQLYTGSDKIISNYNTFYAPISNVFYDGSKMVDFNAWKARIARDYQSKFADPAFIDPSNGNFNISASSPLMTDGNWAFVTASQADNAVNLTANRNAVIRYTLDGTLPIKTSPIYTMPLSGVSSSNVIARAYSTDPVVDLYSPVSGINNKGIDFASKSNTIPTTVQAEDFSMYQNSDYLNRGGQYRNESVGIETCSDVNGGFDVGYTNDNEWLQYNITAAITYRYDLKLRIAGYGGMVSVKIDGNDVIANTNLPSTGGWQLWQDFDLGQFNIESGNHSIQITFAKGGFNFNYFRINYAKGIDFTGDFKLLAKHSGMAMTADPNSNVYQQSFAGTDFQKWNLQQVADGVYKIINKNQGLVLDVAGGLTDNQTNIDVFKDLNQPNQQFGLLDIGNGYYNIIALQASKNVEVFQAKMGEKDNISIYQDLHTDNQKWLIEQFIVATQSSVDFGCVPSRAVDGNSDGIFINNSVTQTLQEPNPWLTLDRKVSLPIVQLKISNRTDCCQDRLHDFYVFVSDQPFASTDPTTTVNTPGVWSYYFPGIAGNAVILDVNRSGRYIRIQIPGSSEIESLAEVEITSGLTVTTRTYTGSWDFMSSPEGWQLTNSLIGSLQKSIYKVSVTASDPFMHSPTSLNLDAGIDNFITIRMRNATSDSLAEFFWITNADLAYEPTRKHIQFSIIPNDTAFTSYRINLGSNPNWTGNINQFRLDPAVNAITGYCSIDAITLGKQTLQTIVLNKGWNLISTNITPADSSIATIFKGLDVQEIKTANTFWRKDQNSWFNSLKSMEAGNGYLVKMNAAGTISIKGSPFVIRNPQFVINSTWSLIGCPYQSNTALSTIFDATNTKMVKNFEGYWIPSKTNNSIQNLEPGKGYFINKK